MKLHQIIKALSIESSTLAKVSIINRFLARTDLREYFKASLDPMLNFYIKVNAIPEETGDLDLTDEMINDIVMNLDGRLITGNSARSYINDIMKTLTPENQILLKNMINRDPNCKVGIGLVNRCWNNLVSEFPCMLAEKLDQKTSAMIIEGPDRLIVQKKEDGGRVAIVVDPKGHVNVYSRTGNLLETHGVFDLIFSMYPGKVFDGELLVMDTLGHMDRKTSNGIFNKAVRQTITYPEAVKLHVVLWDVIDLDAWKSGYDPTPYNKRLKSLIEYLEYIPSHRVSLVETRVIDTMHKAQKFYESMLDSGYEGAMIKIADAPWEAKRSKFVLKMKETNDATLICTGVTKHSKNPEWIGALECETSCGQLKVSIGSGLSEEDRKHDPSYFIGKLIDMQYNTLINSKTSETHSMFLPRFRGIRLDQKTADSLDHLK